MKELESIEGQQIPNVAIKVMKDGIWTTVNTGELFAGKKVVVFSLPGAFTPTCSTSHVPRYNELHELFKEEGVDLIVCVSVNDTFVMNEWQKDQEADNIYFLPDGNGDFTREMGMLVDKRDLGFGDRSWRYSMLVNNKKIEKMFIEPPLEGDPFEVSDADTMLMYLNPEVKIPKNVTILTREGCPWCAKAKELLKGRGMRFEEVVIQKDVPEKTLFALSGRETVPQVFIDGKLIGGYEDLEDYFAGYGIV